MSKASSRRGRRVLKLLLGSLVVYVALGVFIAVVQRGMIYFPAKQSARLALVLGAREGLEPWTNAAGDRIGWRRAPTNAVAQASTLILHGNAGWAALRGNIASSIQDVAPFELFILEFPGYSDRPGSPSEHSFYEAADEAIQLLATNRPVFLVGESLGTGVATYLAGRNAARVKGVLLMAPYNNFASVSQAHMPIFPVKWLLRDRFPSDEHLRGYHGPLAVLLAGRDTVVPNELGRRLYDGYGGPKNLWVVPDAGHNDIVQRPPEWWKEVLAFFRDAAIPGTR